MKNVIISYNMPDMDGIGCMYAYAELLNKENKKTDYSIFGIPKKEVGIVCELFNIELNATNNINEDDKIILVDTNTIMEVKENINIMNVIEIIDHHKLSEDVKRMLNAEVQIEEVGAAATLVAEKYKASNYTISRNAAILLYYGIISNTVNLNSKVTTKRDRKMAEWLKKCCDDISEEKIKEIFERKSEIDNSLREEMEVEYKDPFLKLSWSMGQLEVANVDKFLMEREEEIREVLKQVQQEKDVEYLSVNCVDTLNGYAVIVAFNQKTENLISELLNIKFVNGKAKINEFMTRKEIIKIVRGKYGR